jgi:hypothetical protein
VIALIKNPILPEQSRLIEVKYHLVHERAGRGLIDVEFIGIGDQLGDILTKSLGKIKFLELCGRTGLKNVSN